MRASAIDRGVSEMTGIAVLVLFTVLVTASVGLSAIVVDTGDETVGANFTFEYRSGETLLVTHESGSQLPGGELLIDGPAPNVTWAEVADLENASQPVGPGDSILLSEASAYGQPVGGNDEIRILHAPGDGNVTVLDGWNSEDESGIGGDTGGDDSSNSSVGGAGIGSGG